MKKRTRKKSCRGACGACLSSPSCASCLSSCCLVLVFEHAARDGAADGPDDAVVHFVPGKTACGAASESAHEAAVFGAGLGSAAVGARG